jgi:hypothetical protein
MPGTADLVTSVLQRLYESEINFTVSSLWDCGFRWKVGDDVNGFIAEGSATTFERAVSDLAHAAIEHFPNSAFARGYRS